MKMLLAILVMCLALGAPAVAGEVIGVAVDPADGEAVVFATEPGWEGCKGGAAYKTGNRIGCWVIIDDEQVVFIMWKDGNLSNIPVYAMRLCRSAEACKEAITQ